VTDVSTENKTTRTARRAFALNAGVAWTGVALTVLFSALGWYAQAPVEPGLYGDTPDGAAGALPRVADTLSYFTIWSNIAVGVAVTLLAMDPDKDTVARRVLRLSSLLMITVTAIVYQVVLAPGIDVEGWSLLTDPILHAVTPLVTVVVWAVWGPRGWITARLLPGALAVPLLWILWMLARGAVVDAYPYGFANVAGLGYAVVARNLTLVLLFALGLAAAFWRLDVVLRRRRDGRSSPA
jgi:hypothetical protein